MNQSNIIVYFIIIYYLVTSIIFLHYYFNQPTKINGIYGYRTKVSMQSDKNWKFANKLAAKTLLISNHIILVGNMLIYYLCLYSSLGSTTCRILIFTMPCMILVFNIIFIEIKLKNYAKN
jgi:uncharacterized membrane protein